LNALRAFEAAARHQSFARAAGELALSPGAISRQIKILEDRLDMKLFQRAPQGVSITEAGKRLLASVNAAFDILAGALPQWDRPGYLTIQISSSFYMRWLLPRRVALMAALPKLKLVLQVGATPEMGSGADLAVLFHRFDAAEGDTAPSNAALIFADRSILVASPELLGRRKLPLPLGALAKLPVLANTEDDWDWEAFCEAQQLPLPPLDDAARFDLDDGAIQAALAGQGVALVEQRFVAPQLAQGLLVQPFKLKPVSLGGYYLHWRGGVARRAGLQGFRNWLQAQARQERF
jgi:LysR family glycine cleavage system transcriptional activator